MSLIEFLFTDLTKTIVELTTEERTDPYVAFALKLSSACILNNYFVFFKLYKQAPRMSGYLIDLFVPRMRKAAVVSMIKAYVFCKQVQSTMVIYHCFCLLCCWCILKYHKLLHKIKLLRLRWKLWKKKQPVNLLKTRAVYVCYTSVCWNWNVTSLVIYTLFLLLIGRNA